MNPSTRRIVNVRVTNENKEPFTDEYNGIRYVFAAGKTMSIPLEAAKHIFGYDVKGVNEQLMFEHVCKRWGWNSPANVVDGFAKVKAIWSKFVFVPVAVKMVEQAIIDPSALAETRDTEDGDGEESPSHKLKLGLPTIKAQAASA